MTITEFNYETSYLPGLSCNMDVRAHIWQIYLADLTPAVLTCSGQEWQFQISNVKAHIARSTQQIYPPPNWHPVLKNGNFTFPLLDFILADQLADLPPTHFSAMHHGMYIMGCIWQPLWIPQEKVGIFFYFSIIRVLFSQLAL